MVTSSTRGVAGQRLISSRRRREIVDLPTATDPATATTKGVVVSGSRRNALVSAPRRLVAFAYRLSRRLSGRYTSRTSAMSSTIAEAADLHDLRLGQRLRHVGGQSRPLPAVDLAVERAGRDGRRHGRRCVIGRHPEHRNGCGCRGLRAVATERRATIHPCASESSTSARTPSICSSPTSDPEGGPSRRRASAPSCG